MLRKLSLVAVAAASLAAAALAPTSASAWGGWQVAGTAVGIAAGAGAVPASTSAARPIMVYGGCYVRRLVPTPWGPRWRLVNRCY